MKGDGSDESVDDQWDNYVFTDTEQGMDINEEDTSILGYKEESTNLAGKPRLTTRCGNWKLCTAINATAAKGQTKIKSSAQEEMKAQEEVKNRRKGRMSGH